MATLHDYNQQLWIWRDKLKKEMPFCVSVDCFEGQALCSYDKMACVRLLNVFNKNVFHRITKLKHIGLEMSYAEDVVDVESYFAVINDTAGDGAYRDEVEFYFSDLCARGLFPVYFEMLNEYLVERKTIAA